MIFKPLTTVVILGLALSTACAPPQAIDADLLIQHVTLIDGTGAPPQSNQSVAIKADRIVAVGPAAEIRVQPSAQVVDGQGKYLIPGLWDMHVHLYGYDEHSFPLFLANGVTGVRDMSDNLATSLRLRAATRSGSVLGPEVLISGPTLDADYVVRAVQGTPDALAREAVPNPAAAVAIVDSLARAGVDHLKVHSLTPRAAYFAILEEAKKKGLPVVGHVPDSVMVREAIEAGQRTIEHDTRVELEETPRGAEISRWAMATSRRITDRTAAHPQVLEVFKIRLAAADSALASFDSATALAFGRFAAERPVWFDPTLVVIEGVYRSSDSAYRHPENLKYVPQAALELEEDIPTSARPTAAELEAGRARFRRHLTTIPPLLQAGAKFITGTDVGVLPLVPGFSLLRELELLVQAGLSPMQAIQAATHHSADAAGKLAEMGTVEAGKRASLVLLDADPLADITNVQRIDAVIVKGRLLDRGALDRMLAEALAYAQSTRPERHVTPASDSSKGASR